ALLAAHPDAPRAGDHVVELVAHRVPVSHLLLPGLEAVGVAEEARRVDEGGLFHLLWGESEAIGDSDEAVHAWVFAGRRRGSKGLDVGGGLFGGPAASTGCPPPASRPPSSSTPP